MKNFKKSFIVFLMAAIVACQSNNTNTEDIASEPDLNQISISKAKIDRAGIKLGEIKKELLSKDVHARGKIVVPPQNQASVNAYIGGVIRDIFVVPGEKVRKGQILATYAGPDVIAAQQNYLTAKNNFELYSKEYERQKSLKKENISSDKEFQNTESRYLESKSTLMATKSTMEMLQIDIEALDRGVISNEIQIVSPIEGIVQEVNINVGRYAEQQSALFEVLNTSKLWLEISVFEKDIQLVKVGQRVTFAPSSEMKKIYEAHVTSVGLMVEDDIRVVKVFAKIGENIETLIPGMFASCEIHTSEQYLDALPEEAIVIENEAEKYGFYTLDDPNTEEMTFHRFDVKTGYVEDGFIQVEPIEKLPDQAKIVIEGVYYIRAEIMKNAE
jgi:cobalt-zinc-cadmium efflux system membrane fusion protein